MSSPPPTTAGVLFTAFEPSGDAHAAPVIRELKRRRPDLPIFAWGGAKMRDAGAEVVETTGERAAMGAGSLGKIREHLQINRRIESWLREHPVRLHVPVDSPAANFPICKLTRRADCRIIHLVAPQLWAWGSWRAKKLRRLTDLVLCLLPFEVDFFTERDVPVKFIGHPVMHGEEPGPNAAPSEELHSLPNGSPHVALLPGSRPAEIANNLDPMFRIFSAVKERHPAATAVIAAASNGAADDIHRRLDSIGSDLRVETNRLHDTLNWADVALVCSGTATLDVTRAEVPMVVMYRMNPIPWWLIGRWLISSEFRALPNLIANRRVVPEFIPSYGSLAPIEAAVNSLIEDDLAKNGQVEGLRSIKSQFKDSNPAALAADEILAMFDRAP